MKFLDTYEMSIGIPTQLNNIKHFVVPLAPPCDPVVLIGTPVYSSKCLTLFLNLVLNKAKKSPNMAKKSPL